MVTIEPGQGGQFSQCASPNSFILISSVQSLSRVRHFVTPWIAARQASLSITNSRTSLRLTSIELVMPSSHLILCRPLLLLPPIPPSIRVFSNESTLHMRWPKYWSFSFSISPSKEHPGLISFRMDWLDLLAVQRTLKSLLQHHSSKASILRHLAFFTVQFSHPYLYILLIFYSFPGILEDNWKTQRFLLLLLSHFSRVWLCATPQLAAHQAPPSLGFSRQEHWSGLPFPSPMHESEKWKWSHSVVSNS